MDQVINFIEQVILSDLLIFIVLLVILGLTTLWSLFRLREFAGYVLGWFIGIFAILVFRAIGGDLGPDVATAADPNTALTASDILLPSLLGLALGFGVMFLLSAVGDMRAMRASTIAIITASSVLMLYFMAVSPAFTRKVVGIFALAFSIGALLHVVLLPGPTRRVIRQRRVTTVDSARARATDRPVVTAAPTEARERRVREVEQQTEVEQVQE
jgi:hypothetical protein